MCGLALHKLSRGTIRYKAMPSIQDSLRNAGKLAFQKRSHSTCVFRDAWEQFWAGIVTQKDKDKLERTLIVQHHESMAFISGKFSGAKRE